MLQPAIGVAMLCVGCVAKSRFIAVYHSKEIIRRQADYFPSCELQKAEDGNTNLLSLRAAETNKAEVVARSDGFSVR
jgi:hypothetical protein